MCNTLEDELTFNTIVVPSFSIFHKSNTMICGSAEASLKNKGTRHHSLDEYETNQEAEISALLVNFFNVLDNEDLNASALAKLEEMPPLIINPYRPPKGKRYCEQLTLLAVREWSENPTVRTQRKLNAKSCRNEEGKKTLDDGAATSGGTWLLNEPNQQQQKPQKHVVAAASPPPQPAATYAYSVFEATRVRPPVSRSVNPAHNTTMNTSAGSESQKRSTSQGGRASGISWRW